MANTAPDCFAGPAPECLAGQARMADEAGRTGARLANIDIFRGLAIVMVVLHHEIGMMFRHSVSSPVFHKFIGVASVTIHFSVPCFLFMTALVFTRSAFQRPFDTIRFYRGRLQKTLRPYLIWTVFFAVFTVVTIPSTWDSLLVASSWWHWLIYGKAYYHLYFLDIVLQFYLVLPLLLMVWRWRLPFWPVLTGAFLLQALVFYLNQVCIHFLHPTMMAVWYMPVIAMGMYVGANEDFFGDFWRKHRWKIILIFIVACGFHAPPAYTALMLGKPVDLMNWDSELSNWVFTTGAAIIFFGVSKALAAKSNWLIRRLQVLGQTSLQIYLLHPIILHACDRIGFPGNPFLILIVGFVYFAIALFTTSDLARRIQGNKLSLCLFGR